MDKKKSRDPKDTITFIKEWVSDNLRYILLAAAVIIIVLIIIFALTSSPIKKADSSSAGNTAPATETSSVNENGIATEDKTSAGTADNTAAGNTSASSEDKSAQAGAESSASSEGTPQENTAGVNAGTADNAGAASDGSAAGGQLTVAAAEVSSTIETYLTALAAANVDAAASVSENLTESEIAAITQGAYPSPIEHIVAYAYPGKEEGSYVAIVRFDATDRNTLVSIPACSAYYLITADTGAVLMASADNTAAHQAEIDEVLGYPAVQQLIADVSNAAQAVLASAGQ